MNYAKSLDKLDALKLVVVTLQYPPTGGGYSERMTGFIKQWTKCNLQVVVVTAETQGMGLPEDHGSVADVSGVHKVYYLPTVRGRLSFGLLKNGGKFNWLYRLFNRLCPVDAHLPWSLLAARQIIKLIKNDEVNVFVTTSTPYSVHIVGLIVKRLYPDVKWVADFRDPWTTNYQKKKDRLFFGYRYLNKYIEQKVYSGADRVVINTHQNLIDLQNEFEIGAEKMEVIQNGFDPDIPTEGTPHLAKKKGGFRIGYVGGFRGDWFEAAFIEGLFYLKNTMPDVYQKIEVILVGVDKVRGELALELGVLDRFRACGFHPRNELGGWFSSMDALVLILPENRGNRLGWVPQRLYLYLATKLPILCIAPEGEASDYVKSTRRGIVIAPSNSIAIANKLQDWVVNGVGTEYEGLQTEVDSFSKVFLARKFVKLIHELHAETLNVDEKSTGVTSE